MRIVISGTHASGKSTLVSDFAIGRPEFTVLPDPFDLMDETWDSPGAAMFAAQLRIAADRLLTRAVPGEHLIAERGPLDFLAYLLALEEGATSSSSRDLLERAAEITAEALASVELLVVLPLAANDGIRVGPDEDPALRAAMNDILLELVDDPDLIGDDTRVVEIVGARDERLAALEAAVEAVAGEPGP